jgi:hypothetical protein
LIEARAPVLPSDAHSNIQALYAYWDRKRAGRSMPARADIQPVEIAPLMPQAYIVDASDDGKLSYRLFGTSLVALFGREMTGRPMAEGLPAQAAEEARARYRTVIRDRQPLYHQAQLHEPRNNYTEVERLILPLSPNDIRVDMMIGIVVPKRLIVAQAMPALRRVSGG